MPPRCDLEAEKALHDALRGWIAQGAIKSAHDCSEGGLAVCLAESCISRQVARETPSLIGADVDLSSLLKSEVAGGAMRLDALLFGETQSRIVISSAPHYAAKILGQAKILEIPAAQIGVVGGDELRIKAQGDWVSPLAELHDLWWNSIRRAMESPLA